MNIAFEIAVLFVGVVAALGVHELCHAAVCEYVGVDWRLTIHRDGIWSGPAVQVELRQHTPETLRCVALAPLVMALPVVAILAVVGPATVYYEWGLAGSLLFLWSIGAIPSKVDLEVAWRANELETYHDVWYGEHRTHRLAEGIP